MLLNKHRWDQKLLAVLSTCAVIIILVVATLSLLHSSIAGAQGSGAITGYAWSNMPDGSDQNKTSNPSSGEGLGWVSFSSGNCDADGDGKSDGVPAGCPPSGTPMSPYGISANAAGILSGKAWSEYAGWISFDSADTAGCPAGSCQAQIDPSSGFVTGWARALANTEAQSGGWDGWIHLSGENYAVKVSCNQWSGYAWGGADLGWIQFGGPNYGPTGGGGGSSGTATIGASQTVLTGPGNVTITWSSTCSTVCTGTGSNFSTGGAPNGSVTVPVSTNTTFSVTCTNPSGQNPPPANVTVIVAAPSPSATLSANPNPVDKSATTQLHWAATDVVASSCKITGGGLNVPLSNKGTDSGSLTSSAITVDPTDFTLTCTGNDSSSQSATVAVRIKPPSTIKEI